MYTILSTIHVGNRAEATPSGRHATGGMDWNIIVRRTVTHGASSPEIVPTVWNTLSHGGVPCPHLGGHAGARWPDRFWSRQPRAERSLRPSLRQAPRHRRSPGAANLPRSR